MSQLRQDYAAMQERARRVVEMQTTASMTGVGRAGRAGGGGGGGGGGGAGIKGHELSQYSAIPSSSSRSPTEQILREKGKGIIYKIKFNYFLQYIEMDWSVLYCM